MVCSDTPSLREVVGGAAVTFDPTRPEDIAAKLRRVWEVEGLRRELVERGRARSREFSWERTARQTIEVLKSACLKIERL